MAINNNARVSCCRNHLTPEAVLQDNTIPQTYKVQEIVCSIISGKMNLDSAQRYLIGYEDKRSTDYRKMLCAYDYKKYGV